MLSNTYQCVSYSRGVRRRVEGPVEVVHAAVDGTPRRESCGEKTPSFVRLNTVEMGRSSKFEN